jgi:hypothetical protein
VITGLHAAQVRAEHEQILLETDRLIEESRKLRRHTRDLCAPWNRRSETWERASPDSYTRNSNSPDDSCRSFEIEDALARLSLEIDPGFQPTQEEDPPTVDTHLNSWTNEGVVDVASFEAIMFITDDLKQTRVGQDWNIVAPCPVCRQGLSVTYSAAKDRLWLKCATGGCVNWMDHVPEKERGNRASASVTS